MNRFSLIAGLVAALAFCGTASAALISRLGGHAYYDDVLDITWLADANLADTNTFGIGDLNNDTHDEINSDGYMSWSTANTWISNMNSYGGTGYLGFNDWRLPTLRPVDGTSTFNMNFSNNGTTDLGTGATAIGWRTAAGEFVSEMCYMFYVNLGNVGYCKPNGFGSSSSCDLLESNHYGPSGPNRGPFSNLEYNIYWSGVEVSTDFAWAFDFLDGVVLPWGKNGDFYVWAVRSGDVTSPVPLPGTLLLLAVGLMGLPSARLAMSTGRSWVRRL